MINDNISKIENKINNSKTLNNDNKAELLKLLNNLKNEISDLYSSHQDDAQSIANFTEITTHEATRTNKKSELMELSRKGLLSSVNEFETSHPKLTEAVNAFAELLSKIGI